MRLRLEGLGHAYDGAPVLEGIDLDVPAGRVLCLVGPSGCGKSTLLRLIGGLERPTRGVVLSEGEAPPGCLNPLTYVFQDFALLPWRSVAGNVALPLEGRGLSKAERDARVADALERVRLTPFVDALPKQLSGGMRQRVAIARALAVRPAVWLLDEPLSALDAQTRELLMEDLVGLWTREPFTAVYVTHNLSEAVRLGHAIVVMSRRPGRVREVVRIDADLGRRGFADPAMEAHERRLWRLMREEAQAADAELLDA